MPIGVTWVAIAVHLTGCSIPTSSPSNDAKLVVIGEQQAVPEYEEKPRAVIVSGKIFEESQNNGGEFLQSMLSLGVPQIWLLVKAAWIRSELPQELKSLTKLQNSMGSSVSIGTDIDADIRLLSYTASAITSSAEEDRNPIIFPRDYAPTTVLTKDGRHKMISFEFVHHHGGVWEQLSQLIADTAELPHIRVEFIDDKLRFVGGDFMIDEFGVCVGGSDARWRTRLEVNSLADQRAQLRDQDAWAARFNDYNEKLQAQLGCQDFVSTKYALPGGFTNHIDMFAKFAGQKRVLVADLDDEVLADAQRLNAEHKMGADGKDTPQDIHDFLDYLAEEVFKDYKVLRVPTQLQVVDDLLAFEDGVSLPFKRWIFGSYINSFFVGNDSVVIPWYSYANDARAIRHRHEVEEAYRSMGFENQRFVDASGIAKEGGAWHCASMQVPTLSSVAEPCLLQE